MRKLFLYYSAFLIWILKIIFWLSIILIPIERLLSDDYNCWREPFYEARITNLTRKDIIIRKIRKNEKK